MENDVAELEGLRQLVRKSTEMIPELQDRIEKLEETMDRTAGRMWEAIDEERRRDEEEAEEEEAREAE